MQLDISNLAYIAGEVLGIGEFAGGVFCVFALWIVSIAIIAILTKKIEPAFLLIDGVMVAGLGLALGWVDLWLPALVVLIIIFYIVYHSLGD